MMDLVGMGAPCMDMLARISGIPEANGGASLLEYSLQGGGNASTAIVAAARLGKAHGSRVGMIAALGDCEHGRYCVEDFRRHGVDTSRIRLEEGKSTSFCIVLSDVKEKGRSFLYKPGDMTGLTLDEGDLAYLRDARYMLVETSGCLYPEGPKAVKEAGGKVVIDADGHNEAVSSVLPYVDVFIGSEFYKKRRFGDAGGRECCEAIIAGGAEVAVFTLGAKGCIGMYEGGYFEAPTYDVEVKDTTGCGDVFHGAFVHGLIRGWDVPFIARFANAVASIKCTRLGGRAGIPDEATAMRFMETGVIDYAEIDERVEFYRRVR